MSGSPRLFFGIPLSATARDALSQALSGTLDEVPRIRAIPAGNWHITLRFLGPTEPAVADRISDALIEEDLPPPFSVRLTGCGAFPRAASARVVWIGVQDPRDRLGMLNGAVESAAAAAGLKPEARRYTPHLTIARLRNPADIRSVLSTVPPLDIQLPIDRIVLFQSHLGPSGARYEAVRTFLLAP